MKYTAVFVLCAFLCACGAAVDYITINSSGENEQEFAFLESLLLENKELKSNKLSLYPTEVISGRNQTASSIYIDILSSWEGENNFGDIPVSRNFLVPRINALTSRTDTNLEACLNGTEDLVLIEELKPPYIAIKVNGLALGDEEYPLVRITGINITAAENKKLTKKFDKKLKFLTEKLETAPKPLFKEIPQTLWVAAGGDLKLD